MNELQQHFQSTIYSFGFNLLEKTGLSSQAAHYVNTLLLLIIFSIVLYGIDFLLRRILMIILIKTIRKSKTRIDDFLIHNNVLKNLTHLIPLIIAKQSLPLIFTGFPQITFFTIKIVDVLIIITFTVLIKSIFYTLKDILHSRKRFSDKPLDSYFQVIAILLYMIGAILIFSELTGKNPTGLLTALGAASAIIILVFKDTILGFVASIQVSSNDMVRVGDWIEMPKYGADGDVLTINLSTVKIRNFDNTVTTIPTYALISDSFKNYRTMQKSGGRRIKRSLNIKMGSIRFLDSNEIEDLKRIKLIKSYIIERQQEINTYNLNHVDDPTMLVNGRRMTNIGLFREYVKRYLLNNSNIHKQFHLMVRHMQPTQHGLPIEIYAFTNTVDWLKYEGIMADIFDHILAVVPYFHLELFELPSAADIHEVLLAQINENKNG
ncbi:mechanosensitive ion channel family protein [Paenimyroides aestuarii]|uniref:Mechanosensitive ion channel family protein n=1 Tax=Paenimyroides aestuarii TaxID=2968490 RepID=A0ABY5NVZ5_9FLAO|nr:mechanosensitive ion channel family protein [Paenimyroides aestuarii]UUV22594.1 mechanosensitive ion channel family protein [Paenimyroides aestuarii]